MTKIEQLCGKGGESIYPITAEKAIYDSNNIRLDNKLKTFAEKENVNELESEINSIKNNISDAWNASKTYAVGDYCIDENQLYKCKVQNENMKPASAASYWTHVSVANEVSLLNRDLADQNVLCRNASILTDNIAPGNAVSVTLTHSGIPLDKIVAIIPYGSGVSSHYNSWIIPSAKGTTEDTITVICYGTGVAQKFRLYYTVLYHPFI